MIPRSLAIALSVLMLVFFCSSFAEAQGTPRAPDCVLQAGGLTVLTAVGTSAPFDNRGTGCVDWTFTYNTFGFSAATLQINSAPNNSSSPGTAVAFAGTVLGGLTQPVTASISSGFSQGTISVTGYYPYMSFSLVSKTGTGSLQGTLYGWRRTNGLVPATVIITPNSAYPTPFGIAIAALSSTSGTVATASTVLVGNMFFQNITSGAVTVDVTNTAGTAIVKSFSIPANSNLNLNFQSGLLAVGIKWWASAAASIDASVTGWSP